MTSDSTTPSPGSRPSITASSRRTTSTSLRRLASDDRRARWHRALGVRCTTPRTGSLAHRSRGGHASSPPAGQAVRAQWPRTARLRRSGDLPAGRTDLDRDHVSAVATGPPRRPRRPREHASSTSSTSTIVDGDPVHDGRRGRSSTSLEPWPPTDARRSRIDDALRRESHLDELRCTAAVASTGRPARTSIPAASARSALSARRERAERLLADVLVARAPAPCTSTSFATPTATFVARVDLAYPDGMVLIEYDSFQEHTGKVALVRDSARRNSIAALGFTVLTATPSRPPRRARLRIATSIRRRRHAPPDATNLRRRPRAAPAASDASSVGWAIRRRRHPRGGRARPSPRRRSRTPRRSRRSCASRRAPRR